MEASLGHASTDLLCSRVLAHCHDVKTANVLVDADWNCSLGDFGIARLSPEAVSAKAGAGASTRIIGTPGYIDPDYVQSGQQFRVNIGGLMNV
jgi:serine/threonine protein kinase